ncbi:translation elongation factor Ts [Spirochaeta thermophila]|uniref:Elongation factor Ts n=1 Tax=Winmispira thermophila (strain ATCC 49972 / DSM 6192 / RI 19.B1) TaxID=665571 RepID=E0RTL7_WINT6|nr:translation elongation factor Ts [Spirochaeta thermophila]ADN02248.1 elongation factor Ts [Spirochaeta thermophila DSM 6192]
MAISAADVKKLRDRTGAGIMDCKRALQEAGGDFEKAERILKEMGLAAAAKRSDRATEEGRVFVRVTDTKAGLLEILCETDFVARNQDFVTTGEEILALIMDKGLSIESPEVKEKVTELGMKVKENLKLRRADVLTIGPQEYVSSYVHGEGRIGVLVKFSLEKPELKEDPAFKEFSFDCALHAAAFAPLYLSPETVPADYLEEQKEIFTKQAQNLGKPEKVIQGIVQGKIKKHFAEICFTEQAFVKDDKKSVRQKMEELSKQLGAGISLVDYRYYKVGEEL